MKPKGSIDLDGVLCDFLPEFLAEVNTQYNLSIKDGDVTEYDFTKLGLAKEQITSTLERMLEKKTYEILPVLSGAVSVVNNLSEAYNLMITTSRHPSTKDQTHAWLEKHFPQLFSPVIFNGNNKKTITESYSCVFHIDDCIDHIQSLEGTSTLPVLFSQRYNISYNTYTDWNEQDVYRQIFCYYEQHKGYPSVRIKSWNECAYLLSGFASIQKFCIHPR